MSQKSTLNLITSSIDIINDAIDTLQAQDCTFWACEGKPENNRITNMKTCSRCQGIINLTRKRKKLENLLT